MYIIKNALRCIGRSKGRNILISIIALVIAVSACLGLSIRQAAESAKKSALEELNITATISYDRSSMMNDMMGGGAPGGGGFDRDQFKDMMGSASALTLEQYQTYASAESVEDFYYTLTASFNGSDELLPVTDETEEETESTFESIGGSSQGKGSGSTGGRGGKRPGAGRKKKAVTEKAANGNPGGRPLQVLDIPDMEGVEMPKPHDFLSHNNRVQSVMLLWQN